MNVLACHCKGPHSVIWQVPSSTMYLDQDSVLLGCRLMTREFPLTARFLLFPPNDCFPGALNCFMNVMGCVPCPKSLQLNMDAKLHRPEVCLGGDGVVGALKPMGVINEGTSRHRAATQEAKGIGKW